jgi:hypothetical protein
VLLVCVALERAGYQMIGQRHLDCWKISAALPVCQFICMIGERLCDASVWL